MNRFGLTQREIEVLQAKANFGPGPKVAEALGIALGTVDNHILNISKKMRSKNITHAVAMAWHYGLIT